LPYFAHTPPFRRRCFFAEAFDFHAAAAASRLAAASCRVPMSRHFCHFRRHAIAAATPTELRQI